MQYDPISKAFGLEVRDHDRLQTSFLSLSLEKAEISSEITVSQELWMVQLKDLVGDFLVVQQYTEAEVPRWQSLWLLNPYVPEASSESRVYLGEYRYAGRVADRLIVADSADKLYSIEISSERIEPGFISVEEDVSRDQSTDFEKLRYKKISFPEFEKEPSFLQLNTSVAGKFHPHFDVLELEPGRGFVSAYPVEDSATEGLSHFLYWWDNDKNLLEQVARLGNGLSGFAIDPIWAVGRNVLATTDRNLLILLQ